jgi:hypothetical protein
MSGATAHSLGVEWFRGIDDLASMGRRLEAPGRNANTPEPVQTTKQPEKTFPLNPPFRAERIC